MKTITKAEFIIIQDEICWEIKELTQRHSPYHAETLTVSFLSPEHKQLHDLCKLTGAFGEIIK